MKQGTLQTLGVAALGAAFAATGAGTASAADLGETVETSGRQLVSAPPVQDALAGGSTVSRMPTEASDVVSPDMPSEVAAAEGGDSRPAKLLGGLPVSDQLSGNSLPPGAVTGAVEGGLPTGGLPLG